MESETQPQSERKHYTLADVRASYPPEKAWSEMDGEFPCYLIYRPLSFYLTPPLLRLGIPILAVTLSSLVLAVVMLTVAWRGGPHAYLWVAAIGFCFHVIDCTDGNMARTTGRSSRFGALVDGTVDMTFWALLFASLGLLVEHTGGGLLGDRALEFALCLPILVLINRLTRDHFTLEFQGTTYFRAEIPESLSLGDYFLIAVVGLENLYVFAIAIGGYFGVLDRVLVAIGIYIALIFIGALALTFKNAWQVND